MDALAARWWTIALGIVATLGSTVAAILGPHPHTSTLPLPVENSIPAILVFALITFVFALAVRLTIEPFLLSPKAKRRGSKNQLVTVASAVCLSLAMCSFSWAGLFAFCTSLVVVAGSSVSAQRADNRLARFGEVVATCVVSAIWYFVL